MLRRFSKFVRDVASKILVSALTEDQAAAFMKEHLEEETKKELVRLSRELAKVKQQPTGRVEPTGNPALDSAASSMAVAIVAEPKKKRAAGDPVEVFRLRKELQDMTEKWRVTQERNDVLEFEARSLVADQLMAQAHEISKETNVLIISTANKSILTHSSYANLTNRIQNVCKNLDVIMMVLGPVSVEQMGHEEAARKHNIMAIPSLQEWREKRSEMTDRINGLIEKYARDEYAYNGDNVYR